MASSEDKIAATSSKILVLGATGGTGRLIVKEAVARGHDVSAFVRSAEKGRELRGATLVIGDARDETAMREAVKGKDAIISALGTPASPFRDVTLLSAATRAVAKAMKAEGVARLVAITGIGAGDSAGHGGFIFDNIIMPLLLRKVYADKDRQEDIIRNSGLDWTIVRPSVLNDRSEYNRVRALIDLSDFHGGTISRADVANFVLDQVRERTWVGRAPLITW